MNHLKTETSLLIYFYFTENVIFQFVLLFRGENVNVVNMLMSSVVTLLFFVSKVDHSS